MGQGRTRDNMPPPERPPAVSTVENLLAAGTYIVVYDRAGLQSANNSVWYNFSLEVVNGKQNKVIGHYHIHPVVGGTYKSGNLRVNAGNSFGTLNVGQAQNWQDLCDKIIKGGFAP